MRKRGLALHSDSVDDYIKLAETINDKSGFFYHTSTTSHDVNDKARLSSKQRKKSMNFNNPKNNSRGDETGNKQKDDEETVTFLNFQFDAQLQEYENELKILEEEDKSKIVRKEIVILSSGDQGKRRQEFLCCIGQKKQIEQNGNNLTGSFEEKKIQLVIKKFTQEQTLKNQILSLNIWLINRSVLDEPIIQTYLNFASQIYIASEEYGRFCYPGKSIKSFSFLPQEIQYQLQNIFN